MLLWISLMSARFTLLNFQTPLCEKGTGPICAKHRPPTEGWSGRSGKLDLSTFPTAQEGRQQGHQPCNPHSVLLSIRRVKSRCLLWETVESAML